MKLSNRFLMDSLYLFNMKINITLVLILITSQLVLAQNCFFKLYKHPSDERAFSSFQTTDGNFIIAGEKRVSGYNGNNQVYIANLSPAVANILYGILHVSPGQPQAL